jgi:hypothetical protein
MHVKTALRAGYRVPSPSTVSKTSSNALGPTRKSPPKGRSRTKIAKIVRAMPPVSAATVSAATASTCSRLAFIPTKQVRSIVSIPRLTRTNQRTGGRPSLTLSRRISLAWSRFVNPLQLLSIDPLLSGRVGLEILDAAPEIVGEHSCAWARQAIPRERALLVHHDSRLSHGEFLDLAPLQLG